MTKLFATNKTFQITGITSDTMEPYASTMGFCLTLRPNAVGGGHHYAVSTMVIDTKYEEVFIDRKEQNKMKSVAKAEATERANKMNDLKKEREAA